MRIYTEAYLDRNLGDDLMIRLMAKTFPEHDFYLYIDRGSNMIPFYDLENVHSTDVPFNKNFDTAQFEAVVIIGGSIFMLSRRLQAIERIRLKFPVLRKIRKAGLKLATIGCNLGPFRDKWCEKIACKQLAFSELATVRDQKSLAIYQSYGNRAKMFPDMLFSLEIPYVPPAHKDQVLGISAYRSMFRGGVCMDYYEGMANIADAYVNRTNGKIRLFAFDCEGENDIGAAYTIRRLMQNKKNCEIVVYDGDTDEFIQAFDGCSSLIATRFHSMVLAQVSGIPVLPVVYSNKMEDALDDLNYQGLRLVFGEPIDDAEKVTDLLLERDQLFSLKKSQLEELKQAADGHMESLRKYLEA